MNKYQYINLVCQVAPDTNDYYYLKVPTEYLNQHLEKFHRLGEKISLYFSTEPDRLFNELRGTGNLNFEQFVVKDRSVKNSMTKVTKKDKRSDPYKNFNFRVAIVATAVASAGITYLAKKWRKG